VNVSVSPSASDEEVAAIVAAIEVMWPRAVVVVASSVVRKPTWRFSNRWWVVPLNARRERPRR
jgi:hypothetical protein